MVHLTEARASRSFPKSPDVSPATSFSRSFLNTIMGDTGCITHTMVVETLMFSQGSTLTFLVDLLNLYELWIASRAENLDQGLLICSQTLETQILCYYLQ